VNVESNPDSPRRGIPTNPRVDLAFRFAPRYRVVWVALIALCAFILISAHPVFNQNSLVLVTGLGGVLAIAAFGQLLVIMSGGIDLSVPAVITFAVGVLVHQANGHDGRLTGAIVEVIVLTGAIGFVNGLLVAVGRINALIATLAMSGIVTGVLLLWIGTTFSVSGAVPDNLATLAADHVSVFSVVGLIAIGIMAVVAGAVSFTRLGRNYVAAGTNRVAAEILGIRVKLYEVGGYALAGIFYGIAGIFLAGLLTTPNVTVGDPYQLTTIIAVALGGAVLAGGPASFLCTAAGCFFLALLQQYLQVKSYSAGVSQVANGVVLILAVALVTVGSGRRLRFAGILRSSTSRRGPVAVPPAD
jgi:ribose transport system permease protein